MDNLLLIVILVFAAVVIVGFLFYRQSVRAKITGPGGTGMEFEGKAREPAPPPAPPAAPGPGVTMKNIDAGRDVTGNTFNVMGNTFNIVGNSVGEVHKANVEPNDINTTKTLPKTEMHPPTQEAD